MTHNGIYRNHWSENAPFTKYGRYERFPGCPDTFLWNIAIQNYTTLKCADCVYQTGTLNLMDLKILKDKTFCFNELTFFVVYVIQIL